MAAKFDNLEDINSKFAGTICYYDKKPILIKTAGLDPKNEKDYVLIISTGTSNRYKTISLDDPAFTYQNFNIGYANHGAIAPWYYRRPYKQYQQGLKKTQLGFLLSDHHALMDNHFNFSKPYIAMLENVYPSVEEVKEALMDGRAKVSAFHRDFALSYDAIHKDYVLEYRGNRCGANLNVQLTKFSLTDEAAYLEETLEEALGC